MCWYKLLIFIHICSKVCERNQLNSITFFFLPINLTSKPLFLKSVFSQKQRINCCFPRSPFQGSFVFMWFHLLVFCSFHCSLEKVIEPSRPSISTSTAFCCRLFSFTGIMWKNSGSQLKNKMSACEVLKPNLQHTLEIRNTAFKPGPMCLTRRVWNKNSPFWWQKGPFWED